MSSLSSKYQLKSDKQHVLDDPDVYIGSVETTEQNHWVVNPEGHIVYQPIRFNPGLYQLFDEALVNCRDHSVRSSQIPVSFIDISIDPIGRFTFYNDGDPIDIEKHPDHDIYIPEMIFAHLRSSTNYDKNQQKIVGGKHGLGIKLVFVWSVESSIEIVDHTRGVKYKQSFGAHLETISVPKISSCSSPSSVKLSFLPDYSRFGIEPEAMLGLYTRRIYDLTANTNVSIKYNGKRIFTTRDPKKTFGRYIECFGISPYISEEVEGWKISVAHLPEEEERPRFLAFVNGIHTQYGGTHVEYITRLVAQGVLDLIQKHKQITPTPMAVKSQLFFFIVATVINPSFEGQTKERLTSKPSSFQHPYKPSEKLLKTLYKWVVDKIVETEQFKQKRQKQKLLKKTDGHKVSTIRGIPKLEDATWAGTERNRETTLIICEGDSAKTGVLSGLSSEDRNKFGVYPIQGKLMNISDVPEEKIASNKVFTELKKIVGLETGMVYTKATLGRLRYGRVVFVTDQDLDGHHIKALGMNLFREMWYSLVGLSFFGFIQTPILKATRGSKVLSFYNEVDYKRWKEAEGDTYKQWKIKYYKGLGTSTSAEFKEYFRNVRIIKFVNTKDCSEAFNLLFDKKRADDRKRWLNKYDRNVQLSIENNSVSLKNFVHQELIHFSKYDCERSIPSIVDGLKISQRKILYAAFVRNLTSEIKVAQFMGYISELTHYHHGEASLGKAIVGMARDFVGSNNLNLFLPKGQFGTRLQGGKDHAAERYIYTQLAPYTRLLFHPEDDGILEHLDDDGYKVEPRYFVPILPFVLFNGISGIGTGFSTEVPSYSPVKVCEYYMSRLAGSVVVFDDTPYFRGFRGVVERIDPYKFITRGNYKLDGLVLRVSELPIGLWTQTFKEHLEGLVEKGVVVDFENNSTPEVVDFSIRLTSGVEDIEKVFKLSSFVYASNIHLFNEPDQLVKYECIEEILEEFYHIRIHAYHNRKALKLKELEYKAMIAKHKSLYIQAVVEGTLCMTSGLKQVDRWLKANGFPHDRSEGYGYLLKMSMDSMCLENAKSLHQAYRVAEKELEELRAQSVEQMWMKDLKALRPLLG